MMRTLLLNFFFLTLGFGLSAQTAFINEIDYDQVGTDNAEFIEVAVDLNSCGGPCDPTLFTVVLYNGGDNMQYDSDPLPATPSGTDGAFSLFVINYSTNGVQNSTEGVALAFNGTLIEFISYEGVITAVGGVADGVTSTNVGVSDSNSNDVSIQRTPGGGYVLAAPNPGAPNSVPLPVTLTAFNAKPTSNGAMLEWTTASEENNDYFSVEMGRDAERFSESAQVRGNGTTESFQTYNYEYSNLTPGTYYFRLRQVDYDGQFSYSDVVSLNIKGGRDFVLIANSVLDVAQVEVTTPRPARVLNMAGAQVAEFNLVEGMNNLDVSALPSGMYILSDGNNAKRFVK